MWIEEIFITAFGAFSGGFVKDLSPGLNVLVGHNEAGKTTILEFVRSVFFGFRKKSPKTNIYESPAGKARSGWLTIRTRLQGRLRVERLEKPGLREGLLSIVDDQGNAIDPASLPLMRDGAERRLFQSFFAFDLDSIRQLDQDALRGKIVATALGSFQTNPLDVMKRVDERVKALGRRSSRDDGSLEGIQSRIKEIDKRLKILCEKPKRHEALKIELDSVNNSVRECQEKIRTQEALIEGLVERLRFEEEWKRLDSLDREIVRLEEVRHFPADGVMRLNQALERLREAREGVSEEQKILDHLRDRYESLNPDSTLIENEDAIHLLCREATRLAPLPGEIEKAQAALQRSSALAEQAIMDLGLGWSRERISSSDTSIALEHGIRSFISSWRVCSGKILDLRSRMAEAQERCTRQTEKLQRMQGELRQLESNCRGYLSWESRRRLQEWNEISTRVSDLRERLAEKSQILRRAIGHSEELNERLEELHSAGSSMVPSFPFWALVALLICSGAGLLVVSGGAASQFSNVLAPIGLLLACAVPAIITWKVRGDRHRLQALTSQKDALKRKSAETAGEIAAIERQRRSIIQEIQSAHSEAAEIALQVLGDPNAGPAEVLKAENRSAAAEEPFRQRQALEDTIRFNMADAEIEENRRKEIEKSLRAAEQEMASARAQWMKYLSESGFDSEPEPETALELIRRVKEIKNTISEIEREETHLAEMKEEWKNFSAQVKVLGSQMACPVPTDVSPMDQVEQWMRAEKESREILVEKKTFLEKKHEREVRLGVLTKKFEESQDQIAALMESAAVVDEEAFRERGVLHDQYKALAQERRVLIDNLVSGLRCSGETEMRSKMEGQDWSSNRKLLAQSETELDEARQQSHGLAGRKGRLEKEIETLEAEEESEALLSRKEEWVARLNETAHDWISLKIASSLLTRTLRFYESERQPRVLEKTSELLRSITGGALKRVLLPLDDDSVKVERANGRRMDEELLSRGTLEQVYLSLRLANLESHCNDGFKLPILMDDILVNFDPERAGRTAQALAQFSEETGTQVLFFTCHPHVASLFPPETAVRELGLVRSWESA